MKEWIKAPRLPICLMAGLLTAVSFRFAGRINEAFLPALTVFTIACAANLQNDWRDRFHDVKKGKTLALRQPLRFELFLCAVWVLAASLCLVLAQSGYRQAMICVLMIIAGGMYSETRIIPLLPTLLVALTSASAALLAGFGYEQIVLFALIFGTIFSREIIKDLMDHEIDAGYKWTLPVAMGSYFSKAVAINLAVILMIPGVLFLGSPISVPFIFAACFNLVWHRQYLRARYAIDIAIVCALLSTLI